MTDEVDITPLQQPALTELTPAAAQQELEQLQTWLQDFVQRQQLLDGVKQRLAFLTGFLAAISSNGHAAPQAGPNRAARRASPKRK